MTENEKKILICKYKNEQLEKDINNSINLGLHLGGLYYEIESYTDTFDRRTEIFFILFREMLHRGYLKLQRDNQIIEYTPEEWEAIFRKAWPKKIDGVWTNIGDIKNFEEDDIGIWFITDSCPAYAVWVDPEDRSLEWST